MDLRDPRLRLSHRSKRGAALFDERRFKGRVPASGGWRRPTQGALPDCFFVAPWIANLKVDPEAQGRLVRRLGDGTYEVTFWERDENGEARQHLERVDGDLYVTPSGALLYGHGDFVFALIEKAYAQWQRKTFESLNRGHASDALFALTGREPCRHDVSPRSRRALLAWIEARMAAHCPVVASTGRQSTDNDLRGARLAERHDYAVVGLGEGADGPVILLRNPKGRYEPLGDGTDDGIFPISLARFARLFKCVTSVKDAAPRLPA